MQLYKAILIFSNDSWQGFVFRNQTLDEKILMSNVELSEIEEEIREIKQLLDS
jgi:hypothetical protein